MEELEAKAVKRHHQQKESTKDQRGLLPIKTKKGLILKTTDITETEDNSETEANDVNGSHNEDLGQDDEDGAPELRLNGKGGEHTVLSLLSEREEALEELKIWIGNTASNFMENPEENLINLEKLVVALDKQPVFLRHAGFKLIATSVNELLKDVIPNYKIAHHDDKDTLLKKETLKLQKFEKALLNCAKNHLMKLEKQLKLARKKRKDVSALSFHALHCLCDLLVAHPQFNYAPNIIKLVVPYLDHPNPEMRARTKTCFEQLFKEDKKGEISLAAVRGIKTFVKSKKYVVQKEVIEAMLTLRLFYIDKAQVEESGAKAKGKHKKQMHVSKKELKRRKQLEKVEKEMLEAKGEEAKSIRNKNFTEVAKILFEMLFRIIKNTEEASTLRLLPSALKCISVFCHTINVDFFDDLLKVLSNLLKTVAMRPEVQLLCIRTAFDVLTGPGEFLTYDPGHFSKVLYDLIPVVDLTKPGNAESICSIVRNMIIKRKKLVSRDLVQSFVKVMTMATLHLEPKESQDYLETLQAIKACHLRTFQGLLDAEEHIPSKVATLGSNEALNVGTFSLWELQLLNNHYQNEVTTAATSLMTIKEL